MPPHRERDMSTVLFGRDPSLGQETREMCRREATRYRASSARLLRSAIRRYRANPTPRNRERLERAITHAQTAGIDVSPLE